MIALATTWPEVAAAAVAMLGQGWLSWLAYQSSRKTAAKVEDATVLTRSTDTTHTDRTGAAERREDG